LSATEDDIVIKYIEGCLKQDRESQYALFKHFHGYALGICKRYARNADEAGDILNDSFLKVFNHLKAYDASRPFKFWLGRIVTNTAIDYYRASYRFSTHDPLDGHETVHIDSDIYSKLAYEDLLSLIRQLTPAYRTVFNLYAIDGYNHQEIAEMLRISVGTSKANLHKARKKLQEMLEAFVKEATKPENKETAMGK